MKNIIKRIPIINNLSRVVYKSLRNMFIPFIGSERYWIKRYALGGNSGSGSYNNLADFKSEIINEFIKYNSICSIIDFGCGDGNQLKTLYCPMYLGFDISSEAISLCRKVFAGDCNKQFKLMNDYCGEKAELALSLDVIYHLIEDYTYNVYMNQLFNSSTRFVIIYSSNTNKQRIFQESHVKHRYFSEWVQKNKPEWELIKHIPRPIFTFIV